GGFPGRQGETERRIKFLVVDEDAQGQIGGLGLREVDDARTEDERQAGDGTVGRFLLGADVDDGEGDLGRNQAVDALAADFAPAGGLTVRDQVNGDVA